MNSGDIKKMQAQQTAKLEEIRKNLSSTANLDLKSAELLIQLGNGFWLSEIALQFAIRNERVSVKMSDLEIDETDQRSIWEKVFGHKANE